jgi:microcystin-dependent protein
VAIAQNAALFSLLGTFYGGNGTTTFALPDLRGRFPIGQGQRPGFSNYQIGQTGGSETTTLLQTNLPAHTHTVSYN